MCRTSRVRSHLACLVIPWLTSAAQGGCGSFYAISISHPSFKGLSTMKQHRIVNGLLAEEIKAMHGLQVSPSISLFGSWLTS